MDRSLADITVLVTGASSGIGEATVRHFAAHGAPVAAVARRGERLAALEESVRSDGGIVHPIVADLAGTDEVQAAVEAAARALGRLDVVVNNAGVMMVGPVVDAPVAEWDQMINLNVRGFMYVARFTLPHLIAAAAGPRGVADLVNVASISGRRSRPGSAVYNATKSATIGFSETVRQEVAPHHVRVCAIEPGVVATESLLHSRPEAQAALDPAFGGFEPLSSADVAETIAYVVTRPLPVAINELLLRPIGQLA